MDPTQTTTDPRRFFTLYVGVVAALQTATLLAALHQPIAAVAVLAATGAVGAFGVCVGAWSYPYSRVRDRGAPNTMLFAGGAALLWSAGLFAVAAHVPVPEDGIYYGVGIAMAMLGALALRGARLQRRFGQLIAAHEEVVAFAWAAGERVHSLGLAGLPGTARYFVVATGDRIVWTRKRRAFEARAVQLADVDSFEADRARGKLTIVSGDMTLRLVSLVGRQLEKFERLLRAPSRTRH